MESNEGNQLFGRIYKITSSETDGVYVGSTTRTLRSRLVNHISDYHGYLRGERHCMKSFDIVKFLTHKLNSYMKVYPNQRQTLFRLEGEYIRFDSELCLNQMCCRLERQMEWRRRQIESKV
jgi:hypothetical protein